MSTILTFLSLFIVSPNYTDIDNCGDGVCVSLREEGRGGERRDGSRNNSNLVIEVKRLNNGITCALIADIVLFIVYDIRITLLLE